MALRFVDGFDHYDHTLQPSNVYHSGVLTKWNAIPAGANFYCHPTLARPGSPGMGFGNIGGSSNSNGDNLQKTIEPLTSWIIGFAFYWGSLTSVNQFIGFYDTSGNTVCRVVTDGSNRFVFQRGSTTLGTSATTMTANTWYYFECKFLVSATVGTYEIKLNGSSILSGTGANTGTNPVCTFGLGGTNTQKRFDDLYICDTTGSVNNDFLGPIRVITRRVDHAGSSTQWSAAGAKNVLAIGEKALDDDMTFIGSNTATHKDLYAMEKVPTGTIKGVQVNLLARQDAGQPRVVRPTWRIGGNNYAGTSLYLPGSLLDHRQCYDVSPATSSAWTQSELNGAELGVEVVS